jgi:hypothetical protein
MFFLFINILNFESVIRFTFESIIQIQILM